MAIPVVIAGVAAAIAAVWSAASVLLPESVKDITKEEFMRIVAGDLGELEDEAIRAAFQKMGLEIDPSTGLDAASITDAINNGPLAGSGVELTNIFDRDAIKSDMQKIALAYAAQSFGLEVQSLNLEGIKEALRGEVSRLVREQIEAGGGDLVNDAPDLVEVVRMIEAYQNRMQEGDDGTPQKPPLKMDPESVSNRERQERYRSTHTRHWEAK